MGDGWATLGRVHYRRIDFLSRTTGQHSSLLSKTLTNKKTKIQSTKAKQTHIKEDWQGSFFQGSGSFNLLVTDIKQEDNGTFICQVNVIITTRLTNTYTRQGTRTHHNLTYAQNVDNKGFEKFNQIKLNVSYLIVGKKGPKKYFLYISVPERANRHTKT